MYIKFKAAVKVQWDAPYKKTSFVNYKAKPRQKDSSLSTRVGEELREIPHQTIS
jgi:hypothetical protein